MLYELRKISLEQWFLIIVFILSIMASFLFGYILFRYTELEISKNEIEVGKLVENTFVGFRQAE